MVSSESPTEPDLGERWRRPWWLAVTPAGLWRSLFSPLLLPPMRCNRNGKGKPGSALGTLLEHPAYFPPKDMASLSCP